jgi:ATP-dependent protease ClpP protease subunit
VPYSEEIEIAGLLSLNAERDIRKAIAGTWGCSTLHIDFNSPGGADVVGFRIAQDLAELRRAGVRIETHAQRQCSSAAVLPFAQGNERTASKHARFLLHKASMNGEFAKQLKPSQLRKLADAMDKSDDLELQLLHARGFTLPASWAAQFRNGADVTLSAFEARVCGLVHEVKG